MELNRFYDEINRIIETEQEYYAMVTGDFNAKLEKNEYRMKPWKNSTCITKLIQGAARNNLKFANTNFPRKKLEWTGISPDLRTKTEIGTKLIL